MKTIKRFIAVILTAGMVMSLGMTVMAGQWKQVPTGYHQMGYIYENSDGTRVTNGWQWIDGKCYYFDEIGTMLANTTTPDGYTVDASGAWTVDGVVQTQGATVNSGVNHSAGYDPAHPLAGKIDEWNLRLEENKYNPSGEICSINVHAMLTNQMSQYYIPPVGYSVNYYGNNVYTSQESHDKMIVTEQALYNWFYNWLNSMDFEHMSEMDRAKEIQEILASASYDNAYATGDRYARDDCYTVLIDKKGVCAEFAMTSMSLAKAMGLKSAVYGTGDHAVYYIQIDGRAYFGSNQTLNLNTPTPDRVYFQ